MGIVQPEPSSYLASKERASKQASKQAKRAKGKQQEPNSKQKQGSERREHWD